MIHVMFLFFITSGISVVLSLIAKVLADVYLTERVAIIGSFAGLRKSFNPGVAFGIRLPAGYQEVVIVIALALVCVLAWKSAKNAVSQIGYGLIVGGALGNVIDRFGDGLVTDFFQVGTFPIFNVADACISVGVVFLLAETFIMTRRIS